MDVIHSNFISLCRRRAEASPLKVAYRFLGNDNNETCVTYLALDEESRKIASGIQELKLSRANILLLLPELKDFIHGFLACLYSGNVPVPAYPPKRNASEWQRIELVLKNAEIKLIITTVGLREQVYQNFKSAIDGGQLLCVTLEALSWDADLWVLPDVNADMLACIQYTSGSTGAPKGVMVSHGNLMHNSEIIKNAFGHDEDTIGLGWLPPYHDMGLIGSILQPLYVGFPVLLMSPMSFLQKPINLLNAITKYKVSTAGGPNFFYQLCVDRISPEQKQGINLASWNLAYCGAERIRHDTLLKFASYFAECGFQSTSFYPCYGLAEATLMATGVTKGVHIETAKYQASSSASSVLTLVSCGVAKGGQNVKVINPNTAKECLNGDVGEIWLQGNSVAQGYWKNPEVNKAVFQAYTADGLGPYLRTGDLGFIDQSNLYINGRLKELIIVSGRNYYPEDIELAVGAAHFAISSRAVAFAIDGALREQLVIVVEVKRTRIKNLDTEAIIKAIKTAIYDVFQLSLQAVLIVKPASLPVTSSGKIKRSQVKRDYLDGSIMAISEWKSHFNEMNLAVIGESESSVSQVFVESIAERASVNDLRFDQSDVSDWLVVRLAAVLRMNSKLMDRDELFANFGLDSSVAIAITGELQDWLNIQIDPTVFWEYPSINQMSDHLFAILSKAKGMESIAN